MFENCSVMIIKAGCLNNEICRLELDSDTQNAIVATFFNAKKDLLNDKQRVVFDGRYKPNEDEYLAIENFKLPNSIMDAIRDPIGVPTYEKVNGKFPEIKAIFVGERVEENDSERFNVAFQKFRKEQYISEHWYNLFFNGSTFFQEKSFGISISDVIDCYFTNGELQFASFYFARQIFDLNDYYRTATDQEVKAFIYNPKLLFEEPEMFKNIANTTIRRKIALINDSKVLENYSASKIKELAIDVDIELEVEDDKIKVPNNKEQTKIILGFLDEEAYKGPFSKNLYLANSRRKVK